MLHSFHTGEIEIQERAGERIRAISLSRMIAGSIPPPAISFLSGLTYGVIGRTAPSGDIWAEFIAGAHGFASANTSGTRLSLTLDAPLPPQSASLQKNDAAGLLFIDLATRRRFRVNGTVARRAGRRINFSVNEAFPNCPKYIQARQLAPTGKGQYAFQPIRGNVLTDDIRNWIGGSDTFFVASALPGGNADVSHRGGTAGFIRIEGNSLRIPDYPGNSMYCTLGNFAANPRAGLVFVDIANNRQLQLSGDVTLELDSTRDLGATGNTGRWWVFHTRQSVIAPLNLSFSEKYLNTSPFNPV